ncbi:guanine deaminase [Microdochium bolleyi]|uniref:Guanine deaminase n=1 Tax=Microdochium bolleyi TaxID=196109 RepID=A0A136JEW2_9PEZI|nr:guanine deaminase [Microdochium bolleyi]
MSPSAQHQLFLGSFVHSIALGQLEYLHSTAICVDSSGKIVAVQRDCDRSTAEQSLLPRLGWDLNHVTVTESGQGQFFFPGFIDTHVHAPQYPNVGIFGKSTLLDWLNTYTFPMESSMSCLKKARRVYSQCVRRSLAHGTTTASYFATIHVPATNLLADLCLSLGQRAFVGRVCMDRLGPDHYLDESAEQSVSRTRECIAHIQAIDPEYALVSPIITPRFAPSCTGPSLAALGKLQKETNLPVQTHISENNNEISLVKEQFPGIKTYTDVYDQHDLLTDKTILAHAVHLSEGEADLISQRQSKVAHCPCSNSSITSGEARVRWLLGKGISVGLGTDMSGGYSPSILEAARLASLVSNHLAMPGHRWPEGTSDEDRDKVKLSVEEVLHLATRGGAEVVGLQDRIGGFDVGKEWDAQLIRLNVVPDVDDEASGSSDNILEGGNVDVFGWESWEERMAKWLFNGDDRNTVKVWVKGRLVHARR